MYSITFKESANKELQRLPKSVVQKIVIAIDDLSKNARPVSVKN